MKKEIAQIKCASMLLEIDIEKFLSCLSSKLQEEIIKRAIHDGKYKINQHILITKCT